MSRRRSVDDISRWVAIRKPTVCVVFFLQAHALHRGRSELQAVVNVVGAVHVPCPVSCSSSARNSSSGRSNSASRARERLQPLDVVVRQSMQHLQWRECYVHPPCSDGRDRAAPANQWPRILEWRASAGPANAWRAALRPHAAARASRADVPTVAHPAAWRRTSPRRALFSRRSVSTLSATPWRATNVNSRRITKGSRAPADLLQIDAAIHHRKLLVGGTRERQC